MSGDERELDLRGVDAQRPLPPELRARLERAMLAAAGVAGEPAVPIGPGTLDAPRPLPAALRERMESVLVSSGAAVAGAGGGDGPERRRGPAWLQPLLAVAAVMALVLGSLAVLRPGRSGDGDAQVAAGAPTTTATTAGPPATTASTAAPPDAAAAAPRATPTAPSPAVKAVTPRPPAPPAPAPAAVPISPPPTSPSSPSDESRPAPAPGGTVEAEPTGDDAGPAPPYAYPPASEQAGAAAPSAPAASTAPPDRSGPATGGRLRVGVVGGDAAQTAGFSAYVDLLNRAGGVRGRQLELGAPSGDTVVTVNLSARSLASNPGAGPLLEGLNVTEDRLAGGGNVYSFASPLERQAHLAADALYPESVLPGAAPTAVVYRATDGPYAGVVAEAFRQVLVARGVRVVSQTYDPAQGRSQLVPGDVAFLSLETAAAKAWLADASAAGYGPYLSGRVAGIASLFDPALLSGSPDGALPESARVVSPYVVPPGDEGRAIRSGAGSTSAAALHGWATAKSLAVALWQSGADTPGEVKAALDGLAGYSSGLAPPYETRSGTHSRTPEGALFEVRSSAYSPDGRGFRRDQF